MLYRIVRECVTFSVFEWHGKNWTMVLAKFKTIIIWIWNKLETWEFHLWIIRALTIQVLFKFIDPLFRCAIQVLDSNRWISDYLCTYSLNSFSRYGNGSFSFSPSSICNRKLTWKSCFQYCIGSLQLHHSSLVKSIQTMYYVKLKDTLWNLLCIFHEQS